MTLDEERCWALLSTARHAVLATVHPHRGVDAVPVVFEVMPGEGGAGRTISIPIDTVKPKRSARLQRLANIEADARCVLLVEHYEDEWSQLWWVGVHGRAVSSPSELTEAVMARLADRYRQYRQPGSVGAIITIHPTEVSGWSGSESGGG